MFSHTSLFIAIANAYTALEAGATHIDTCKPSFLPCENLFANQQL